jgi:hypothetical protein
MLDLRSMLTLLALMIPCLALSARLPGGEAPPKGGEPIHIGSRLELFVDEYLIASMKGLSLRLHSPAAAEKVLDFDKPWEGPTSAYVTVFKDGERYRMYYRGSPGSGDSEVTCYAESADGVHWAKTSLGIHAFNGSKDNNIVWSGFGSHNLAPFLDTNPMAPAEQRYKALAGGPLLALVSPDGIHWKKLREEPVLTEGAFDSQNVAFWDAERGPCAEPGPAGPEGRRGACYAAYFRIFRNGVRAIARSTSQDFIHWSAPQPIDLGNTPPEHLYTNATTPYFRAPHILLAFPKRFLPERKVMQEHPNPGVSDGVFMSSRDGLHFDRRFMEAFLRPGRDIRDWTDRNNMIAWGVVPTAPDEISIYYSQNYQHPTAHLRRGVLRTDGLGSVNAPYAGGELVTKPLVFEGNNLVVNYATSAAGSVRAEIQDSDGAPIKGFSLDDSPELYGDEIDRVVEWKGGADLGALAGKPVRVRFAMKDADLYSLRFAAKP